MKDKASYQNWREHGGPPWGEGQRWRGKRSPFLFLRFMVVFGLMALLVVGGMGIVAALLVRSAGGDGQIVPLVWLTGCGLALALPLLAVALAARAWRGIAQPLGSVMEAADALAEGDLSVRVAESERGDFGRLTRSFNRMAAELERNEQVRRNLTADVAHELRTPLHIIQGNLEGVLDGVYEPTDEHIADTLEETQLLARLIEDLRILSLADAGELPLHREPVNVQELIADVITSFSGQAEALSVDLATDVPTQAGGLMLNADPDRLNQVLGNLVANALQHTPAGGAVTLSARPAGEALELTVADTGSGIPPDDLPYIFDRFWRGDRSRTGAGSGLGLAIARQLVAAHGGHITAASAVGAGTTFSISLPR